jgi:hypothetical protein
MEILVKAVNDSHSDPDIDKVSCFKKGYPVVIVPDNFTWGADEGLPLFVVVKVPGVEIGTEYIMPRFQGTDETTGRLIKTHCRDYTFPESIVDSAIDNDGILILSNDEFLDNIMVVE